MSKIIPTIGRIVLVPVQTRRHSGAGVVDGPVVVRPAIITNVFTEDMINVRVFSDGSNDLVLDDWKTSLHYNQDDHKLGTWHWMPYQIQNAPKS